MVYPKRFVRDVAPITRSQNKKIAFVVTLMILTPDLAGIDSKCTLIIIFES